MKIYAYGNRQKQILKRHVMVGFRRLLRHVQDRKYRRLVAEAQSAIARFPTIHSKSSSGLDAPLIVSLTSYQPRFITLSATLRGLLDQKKKADKIVLWLSYNDLDLVPEDVLRLKSYGLEIYACEELLSYKKLIPSLERWPEAYIVTADDDIYYPPDWLTKLVETYKTTGPSIVAWRAHLAQGDSNGGVQPYAEWEYETKRTQVVDKRTALFPTGVGGILYPPNSLHPDVLDREKFMTLCPRADDIWFYWMAHRQGTRHRRVRGNLPFIPWPTSQDTNLWGENVLGGKNDEQIRALEQVYGAFPFGV